MEITSLECIKYNTKTEMGIKSTQNISFPPKIPLKDTLSDIKTKNSPPKFINIYIKKIYNPNDVVGMLAYRLKRLQTFTYRNRVFNKITHFASKLEAFSSPE